MPPQTHPNPSFGHFGTERRLHSNRDNHKAPFHKIIIHYIRISIYLKYYSSDCRMQFPDTEGAVRLSTETRRHVRVITYDRPYEHRRSIGVRGQTSGHSTRAG